jgi:hypothetical protein
LEHCSQEVAIIRLKEVSAYTPGKRDVRVEVPNDADIRKGNEFGGVGHTYHPSRAY